MRIIIEAGRCEAHGDCVLAAPDIFDLGEEDPVVTVLPEPPEELRAMAEHAAQSCPTRAIRLEP